MKRNLIALIFSVFFIFKKSDGTWVGMTTLDVSGLLPASYEQVKVSTSNSNMADIARLLSDNSSSFKYIGGKVQFTQKTYVESTATTEPAEYQAK